ncbi:hypothetical protein D3C75_1149310 [compost metagenome]
MVALPIDLSLTDLANRNSTTSGSVPPSPPTPTQPEKKVSNVLMLCGSSPLATMAAFSSMAGNQMAYQIGDITHGLTPNE